MLIVSYGVTSYSLPRDQTGYWAMKIVICVPKTIPAIGLPLVELLHESVSARQSTLTRSNSLHTIALRFFTTIFMLIQFSMIRKQGISSPL